MKVTLLIQVTLIICFINIYQFFITIYQFFHSNAFSTTRPTRIGRFSRHKFLGEGKQWHSKSTNENKSPAQLPTATKQRRTNSETFFATICDLLDELALSKGVAFLPVDWRDEATKRLQSNCPARKEHKRRLRHGKPIVGSRELGSLIQPNH